MKIFKKRIPWDSHKGLLLNVVTVTATLLGCFLMLEYSCIYGFGEIADFLNAFNFKYFVLNLTVLGTLWSIISVICMRIWLSCLIMTFVCGTISIINHYVLIFHGMPLSFLMIRNLSTAMNVISGYTISIDPFVLRIAFMVICIIAVCILNRRLSPSKKTDTKKQILKNVSILFVFLAFFYICFLGENPLKPKKTISWSWGEGYGKYGFAACSVESFFQMTNVVNEPEGYSAENVAEIQIDNFPVSDPKTPDIILILNETLYDLKQISDIDTDVPYLQKMYQLDNIVSGYAITPSNGGGTNCSEYELLTSNSLELMPGITPFNALGLEGANSITSFLSTLGYRTLACHSATPGNYSRGVGYPALQFDNSYFIHDYEGLESYYKRPYTDESSYANLIRWYENMPEASPRFLYMLTYQNHGAYEQNPPEADSVHVKNNYGEYTQSVNEFLTSISLSDQAFCQLTAYFSNIDRPVIVCMVGDHSPSFASSIISGEYDDAELNLRLRKVPLIYWANFDLDNIGIGTMSMNYIVPTLLKLAGTELSPYYTYMLDLQQKVPILTSYGRYYDYTGAMYSYSNDPDSQHAEMVDNYFYLEYQNLQNDRNQALYMPYE